MPFPRNMFLAPRRAPGVVRRPPPVCKTYCKETAALIEKLSLTKIMTREQMADDDFDEDDSYESYRLGTLVITMKHAAGCTNVRCAGGFCYSMKKILKHYKECFHEDCLECHRFNIVVYEHVAFCSDPRLCNIPGCLSISRANGRVKETAQEECSSTSDDQPV